MAQSRRDARALPTVLLLFIIFLCPLMLCCPPRDEHGYSNCQNNFIGIELGASHIRVGISNTTGTRAESTVVHALPANLTSEFDPPYIAFSGSKTLYGAAAKAYASLNPQNAVFDLRRLVGRRYDEIRNDIDDLPFKVVRSWFSQQPLVEVMVNGRPTRFSPEDLLSRILVKVKSAAESHLRNNVTNAVITVSPLLEGTQRDAIKHAASKAGLSVDRIVGSVTAAGIGHGLDKTFLDDGRLFIFYDLSDSRQREMHVVMVDSGVYELMSSVTTSKDQEGHLDLLNRLLNSTTWTTYNNSTQIHGVFLMSAPASSTSRNPNLAEIQALLDFHLGLSQLNATVSTTPPSATATDLVPDPYNADCDCEPEHPFTSAEGEVGSETAVLVGATQQAYLLYSCFGWITCDGFMWNFDINPLSLGIETTGGGFHKMVPRYQTLPTRKTAEFAVTLPPGGVAEEANEAADPAAEMPVFVNITVVEGERALVTDNRILIRFELELESDPQAPPRVQVTFELDANGVVTVMAKQLFDSLPETSGGGRQSGKEVVKTLRPDIDRAGVGEQNRMVQEAEIHAGNDQEVKESFGDNLGLLEGFKLKRATVIERHEEL